MSFRFKPEQFSRFGERSEAIACLANNLLEEFVKTLPEVFAQGSPDRTGGIVDVWAQNKSNFDSGLRMSRARLWGVEEIKPTTGICVHGISKIIWSSGNEFECECDKCGAILKPSGWEPVDPKTPRRDRLVRDGYGASGRLLPK